MRSCKQNTLEGSKAALTSKETEIKLTSVGRASLEELLADYRDYLRVSEHALWEKGKRHTQHPPLVSLTTDLADTYRNCHRSSL